VDAQLRAAWRLHVDVFLVKAYDVIPGQSSQVLRFDLGWKSMAFMKNQNISSSATSFYPVFRNDEFTAATLRTPIRLSKFCCSHGNSHRSKLYCRVAISIQYLADSDASFFGFSKIRAASAFTWRPNSTSSISASIFWNTNALFASQERKYCTWATSKSVKL